jgi:hypothetical protein
LFVVVVVVAAAAAAAADAAAGPGESKTAPTSTFNRTDAGNRLTEGVLIALRVDDDDDGDDTYKTYPYLIGKVEEITDGNRIGVFFFERHLREDEPWWVENKDGSQLTMHQKIIQAREWHWQEMPRLRGVNGHHQFFPNDDYQVHCWYSMKLSNKSNRAAAPMKKKLEPHALKEYTKLTAEYHKLKTKIAAEAMPQGQTNETNNHLEVESDDGNNNNETASEEIGSGQKSAKTSTGVNGRRGKRGAVESKKSTTPSTNAAAVAINTRRRKRVSREEEAQEEEEMTDVDRLRYLEKNIFNVHQPPVLTIGAKMLDMIEKSIKYNVRREPVSSRKK